MWNQTYRVILILIASGYFNLTYGCTIEGVEWVVPVTREINDTFRGIFFSSATQDIQDPVTLIQNDGLNEGPYLEILLSNSVLTIGTNDKFPNYEEVETQRSMRYTVDLRCTDGTRRNFVLILNIVDTNNNDPRFLQPNYEFHITLPVPPGFLVNNCENDIVVRDIDLTTQRIDFKLEGSDLFEISYDPSYTVPKEFKSILRTNTLIRYIPEPITLTLTATDVDLTGDPPRSTTVTVIIKADNQFQFPYEPRFSRSFYLASYEKNNGFVLQDTIYLEQGYDDQVKFSFESDYSEYFNMGVDDNKVQFSMNKSIPVELYEERQIYLVVNAEREYTSGATATVILNLPKDTTLEFQSAIYKGTITDNVLLLTNLILEQGYEDSNITVDIRSEYTFRANVISDVIQLSMDPLTDEVIRNNTFIALEVIASNNRSSATTAVVLEIIKDDYVTPVFERYIYNGSYSNETGLTMDNIILVQGYDETVEISLEGDHSTYFQTSQDGPVIKLVPSAIPEELLKTNIILTIVADKPRTVGAHATINIAVPTARYLVFEKDLYIGAIKNNNLTLDNIVLTDGYGPAINFTLTGQLANHFTVSNDENIVTVLPTTELPETVVLENDIIVLTLVAFGTKAIATSTSIVIRVIKDDYRTPVFNEKIYSIEYGNDKLNSVNLTLIQGFDETVTFEMMGVHREFFSLEPSLNTIKLAVNSTIPEDIIFNEKVIILNVVAHKPRTVGANAAVYITFPPEMTEPSVMNFTQNAYKGSLKEGVLVVEDVILEFGYTPETEFILSGEHSDKFSLNYSSNVVTVMLKRDVSLEVIERQNFITLEVTATRERTVPALTIVVLFINKTEIISPIFDLAFYQGSYKNDDGLIFEEVISLQEGFDNTVEFILGEEYSRWFILEQNGNSVILNVNSSNPIPEDIVENNQHLLFTIFARKPETVDGRAAIYIDLPKEYPTLTILRFEKQQYIGEIENNTLHLENIRLSDSNVTSIEFNITGEFSSYFTITKNLDSITINYSILPEEIIENNTFIVLNIEASRTDAINGHTTIILDIVKNKKNIVIPIFDKPFYTGKYLNSTGLEFQSSITLAQGFDETVAFDITSEDSQWFDLVENGPNDFSLRIKNESINQITEKNRLIFTVIANKPNITFAHATVIISLKESNVLRILQFEKVTYLGHIKEQLLYIEPLRLLEENISSVEFNITGDYSEFFTITKFTDYIEINLLETSPELIENNDFIVLNIEAFKQGAISGHTTIVVDIINDLNPAIIKPIFSKTYYKGQYSKESDLVFSSTINLVQGFNETVIFKLDGDDSQWFTLVEYGPNNFTLNIKNDSINDIVGKSHLVFTVVAQKPNTTSGRATIVISIVENSNVRILQFEQVSYLGSIEKGVIEIDEIRLKSGITSTTDFIITGDYATYFKIYKQTESIQIILMDAPPEIFENNHFIILNIKALEVGSISGHTTVVLNIIKDQEYKNVTPVFSEAYYTGQYSKESGFVFLSVITLAQGYDESVTFEVTGHDSRGFTLVEKDFNNFTLAFNESLSGVDNRNYLLFSVLALKPNSKNGRAAIVISKTGSSEESVFFDKILYNGKLEDGILSHDTITLTGFSGTNILISGGEHSRFFQAEIENGFVKVTTTSTAEFQKNLTYITLELQAGSARSVLLIDVSFSEDPDLPKVSFKSQSYFFWADVQQTGEIGRVEATADNDEAIIYSLLNTNDHMVSRIIIGERNGVIQLTNTAEKGIYNFNVIATSTQTQVQARAAVLLRVDTLPECGDEVGLSPLIVIERLEEEAYNNLVVLNKSQHVGCQYTLRNVFPENQTWLYVDSNGLHTKSIDREDKSIAFMTLSQIQVELTLKCDSDEVPAFAKRSLGAGDSSNLYSYDYGPNKWVLTDTILYNARRSYVNLIVNDINDNSPKFNGKENEIIYVGYPVSEIEGIVLPRALAELKATDADIGENAAIMYWSGEDNLAVSPKTGLVHVRNNAKLENNSRLTVYAIDQNGKGNNGSIDIVVKLLNKNQIAVLTIRNAFLEDETTVLNDLSNSVGYEIKVLNAIVISENYEESNRRKRDIAGSSGSSLQLYVYGLLESEPIDINQLTGDINNSNVATITIARILSLQDHLEGLEICPGLARDIGLLAATIALSILILILITVITVFYFLKWRITRNYERFSDRSSSTSQLASPKLPIIEIPQRTRPNMEEIKRSERRLQEMLEKPVESALDSEPDDIKNPNETPDEAIVSISSDAQLPIIIQSIDKLKDSNDESDDNDEYGEMRQPRKSVVTFNENVEKIIHIEDVNEDESSEHSYEVYKF